MVRGPLADLAALFLRLGVTAFGGPAAHIAMMRDEVVERRRWLTDAEFLDLLAATNLIPGPNSTEMAIHLGYKRGGLPGLVVAGVCFILPASLIVGVIAAAYAIYGDTPQVDWLMYGIGPIVIAIILQAVVKLGRSAIRRPAHALLGVTVTGLALAGVDELALLAGGAAAGFAMTGAPRTGPLLAAGWAGAAAASLSALGPTVSEAVPFSITRLTLFFAKVGSVLFGSGYVLVAFLRADLTERWGWLTDQQLVDAITVGQVTPGPVFTTATFIGYLLGGWTGAVMATLAIFAPGFVFVAISQPLIPRLRASRPLRGLLDGVVVTSVGLMVAVVWPLAQTAVVDLATAAIGLAAVGVLLTRPPNSTWLILAGALLGWVLQGSPGALP